MRTMSINTLLDNFNALLLEEKEFAVNLIRKSFAEAEREAIFKRVKKANENFKNGKVKKGNINDLYNDLEND